MTEWFKVDIFWSNKRLQWETKKDHVPIHDWHLKRGEARGG